MLEDKDTLLDIADRRWAQALAEAGGTGLGEEAGEHRLGLTDVRAHQLGVLVHAFRCASRHR